MSVHFSLIIQKKEFEILFRIPSWHIHKRTALVGFLFVEMNEFRSFFPTTHKIYSTGIASFVHSLKNKRTEERIISNRENSTNNNEIISCSVAEKVFFHHFRMILKKHKTLANKIALIASMLFPLFLIYSAHSTIY